MPVAPSRQAPGLDVREQAPATNKPCSSVLPVLEPPLEELELLVEVLGVLEPRVEPASLESVEYETVSASRDEDDASVNHAPARAALPQPRESEAPKPSSMDYL